MYKHRDAHKIEA